MNAGTESEVAGLGRKIFENTAIFNGIGTSFMYKKSLVHISDCDGKDLEGIAGEGIG